MEDNPLDKVTKKGILEYIEDLYKVKSPTVNYKIMQYCKTVDGPVLRTTRDFNVCANPECKSCSMFQQAIAVELEVYKVMPKESAEDKMLKLLNKCRDAFEDYRKHTGQGSLLEKEIEEFINSYNLDILKQEEEKHQLQLKELENENNLNTLL